MHIAHLAIISWFSDFEACLGWGTTTGGDQVPRLSSANDDDNDTNHADANDDENDGNDDDNYDVDLGYYGT